ncbi:MAG: hypothetical protein H7Y33_09010 [Cytophagales bacterium]|nr:hypothetical protein [Rhizobacter sp.]
MEINTEHIEVGDDEAAGNDQVQLELMLCELLAVDYYERIKALYCGDQFSKDEPGWQALIDSAWRHALVLDAQRRKASGRGGTTAVCHPRPEAPPALH